METTSNTSNSLLARRSSRTPMGHAMKRMRYLVPMLLVSIALTSCLGQSTATTHVRGVNLVTDSPTLGFQIDTTVVATASYGGMTNLAAAHPGAHTLQVSGVTPSDLVTQPTVTYIPFGTPVTQNLVDGTSYTLIAYGTVADPKFITSSSTTLTNGVADNTFTYQVINAAPNGPPVDVYVTAPGAGVATATKVGSLTFGQSTNEISLTIALPVGQLNTGATLSTTFTIELRNSTTGAEVIAPNTITISEQTRALFVVADNTGPGATPVAIDVLIGSTGAAAAGSLLANPTDNAELAFANVSPDSPPYKVIGGLSLQDTLAASVAFGQKSAYAPVPGNTAGTIASPVSNPTLLTFITSFASSPEDSYTEYAVGPFATVAGVVLSDDRRTVPIQGEFRILNAAVSLQFGPTIDIYYTTNGAAFDITAQNTSRPAPNFASQAYKSATGYTQLVAGTYDVYIANTGTSDIILGPVPLAIKNGTNTTYALTNTLPSNGLVLLKFNDGR
jgi:Domain of unknown function (DUF4397)